MNLKNLKRISDSEGTSYEELQDYLLKNLVKQVEEKGEVKFAGESLDGAEKEYYIYKLDPKNPMEVIKKIIYGPLEGDIHQDFIDEEFYDWHEDVPIDDLSTEEVLEQYPDVVLNAFTALAGKTDISSDAKFAYFDPYYDTYPDFDWANESSLFSKFIDDNAEWLVPLYQYLLDNGVPLSDLNYVNIYGTESVTTSQKGKELEKEFYKKYPDAKQKQRDLEETYPVEY